MGWKEENTIAVFYCQNVPGCGEQERQAIEGQYARSLRLFPIPCGGRLEAIHLLKALEEFADAVYVITCPPGTCRYFEGNQRAEKRVFRTKQILESIGLEAERIGMIPLSPGDKRFLADLTSEIREHVSTLPPSPVFHVERGDRGGDRI